MVPVPDYMLDPPEDETDYEARWENWEHLAYEEMWEGGFIRNG